jgi:hypothetical protein
VGSVLAGVLSSAVNAMMRADRDSLRRRRLSVHTIISTLDFSNRSIASLGCSEHKVERSQAAGLQKMAQQATTPTFKEGLKQNEAQFEDCTPCRVVGTTLRPRATLI